MSTTDDAGERLRRGPKLDPAGPAFWDVRFRERFTPWDAGGVPAAVREFLAREPAKLRVLIPGCGSAYEARTFAEGIAVPLVGEHPFAIIREKVDEVVAVSDEAISRAML